MPSKRSNSEFRRVLIVTATVGSGHNATAQAILAGLKNSPWRIDAECVDVLSFTPWAFRAYYAGGFALLMTRFPHLYGVGFWVTNRPTGPSRRLTERRRLWTERLAMRGFADYLRSNPPELIVNTHFLAAPMIANLIHTGGFAGRQFVVVTDNEVHRFWYSQGVDRWFVPADYSAGTLSKWGIDAERITVSGIPLHPKWSEPLDRERIFCEWNLPRNKKIVLLSGGTEFTCGPIAKIARSIALTCDDAYVVVLAGRNKKLLAQLTTLRQTPSRVIGVGFTDRIHELVEVCSLMVTKSGGITTAECLAKGVPMVLLKPIPGHEAGNAKYLQQARAAIVTRSVNDVAETVARLLKETVKLKQMSESARGLYRPGISTIVNAICQCVCPPGENQSVSSVVE